MNIKRVMKEDLDTIKTIWIDFMLFHQNLDPYFAPSPSGADRFAAYLESKLEDDDFFIILGEEKGEIIGYLIGGVSTRPPVFTVDKEALITDIVLKEGFRGKKHGDLFVDAFKEWAKEKNLGRVILQVLPGNEKARRFYSRLGFKDHLYTLAMEI